MNNILKFLIPWLAVAWLVCPAVAQEAAPEAAPEMSQDSAAISALPIDISSTETTGAPPEYVWTLDDVLRIAFENNPDLQSARANFQAAAEVVGEAVSGYLPSVDGFASSVRTTLPQPSAGLTAFLGENRPYTMGVVSIRQILLDFGKNLENIEASRAEKRSAEQDVFALHNLIELNTERAFYDVAAAQKLVEVAKKSMAQFQETYRRADMQVKTGVRPPFDRTQAEVELAKAQLALINARSTRDLARIALVNIMGMRRQVTFALKEGPVQTLPASVTALDMQRLTDVALRERPEMRRADFRVESAVDRLKEQRFQYTPTFNAAGWYGDYAGDYPIQERGAWGFGVNASMNLFDGLSTTFRLKELKFRLEQQEASAKRQSENIVAEVAVAYMNLMRAEQNETVADEGAEFAKENFQFARKRYDADVGTILELLVAETSLVNAEAVQVEARYRYATGLAALKRAVNAPLIEAGK